MRAFENSGTVFQVKGPARPCSDLVQTWPGGGSRESSIAGDIGRALIGGWVDSLGVHIGEVEELKPTKEL